MTAQPGPRGAILCVDDEPVVLNSLKRQLRQRFGQRFLYETAESAAEAWEVIEELVDEGTEVFVVVSDWQMPEMTGDVFLAKVHHHYPQVATILLTGQATAEGIDRAMREGNALTCMKKPWEAEQLADWILSATGPSS